MLLLILHLVGDYLLQSQWMSDHKAKPTLEGLCAAWTHALSYSLPFLVMTDWNLHMHFWICGSHFIIDRYRVAVIVVRLKNWMFSAERWESLQTATGYPERVPSFLSVWLLIIADNTLHLICNYLAFRYC